MAVAVVGKRRTQFPSAGGGRGAGEEGVASIPGAGVGSMNVNMGSAPSTPEGSGPHAPLERSSSSYSSGRFFSGRREGTSPGLQGNAQPPSAGRSMGSFQVGRQPPTQQEQGRGSSILHSMQQPAPQVPASTASPERSPPRHVDVMSAGCCLSFFSLWRAPLCPSCVLPPQHLTRQRPRLAIGTGHLCSRGKDSAHVGSAPAVPRRAEAQGGRGAFLFF